MRRQQLVAIIHLQRSRLSSELAPVGRAARTLDAGMRAGRRVGRHPEWLAAAAALTASLVLLKARPLSSAMRFCTRALRAWRVLAPALQRLARR